MNSAQTLTDQTAVGTNKLQQLKAVSVVVADTGDIEAIRGYQPQRLHHQPVAVLKARSRPPSRAARRGVEAGRATGDIDDVLDRLTVALGAELARIVPGASPPRWTPACPLTATPRSPRRRAPDRAVRGKRASAATAS